MAFSIAFLKVLGLQVTTELLVMETIGLPVTEIALEWIIENNCPEQEICQYN